MTTKKTPARAKAKPAAKPRSAPKAKAKPAAKPRPAPKAKAAAKPRPAKAAPKPKAPPRAKAKVPAKRGRPAKPAAPAGPRLPPNTPDMNCNDPTIGQVVDLRHCELPPGGKRRKCTTVRSVVVGCATPSEDKPKRKQMYAVPQGRQYVVPVAEVRRDLRAGERARTRMGLPDRTCEDYSAARARGIPVSQPAYNGEECARYDTPEPTAFTPRADDPWESSVPVPPPPPAAPAAPSEPGLSTDPRLMQWTLSYLQNGWEHDTAEEAVDSLTRISGSRAFAQNMLARWTNERLYNASAHGGLLHAERATEEAFREAYAETKGVKANGRRAAATHGDLPPLAGWARDKHGHTVTGPGTAWPDLVTFDIGPVFDRNRRRIGYVVSVVGSKRGVRELVTPAGAIVPNTALQARHLVRSPEAGVAAARKAWSSFRRAKRNDGAQAAAPRGVAVPGNGRDPIIGRRVGGEEYAGFVRAPARGCDGKAAYIVGGEVVPRTKVLAAIRKAEINAGLREPPARRGARVTDATRAPVTVVGASSRASHSARAPLGLPAPAARPLGYGAGTMDTPRRVAPSAWATAQPGNVVEFRMTRADGSLETREEPLRGVVFRRYPTDPRLGEILDLYALERWDREEQRWNAHPRQDSLRVRADMGRLVLVAPREPLAREHPAMMEAFRGLQAAYTAAHRTLAITEAAFGDQPVPEASADLARSEARLREIHAELEAERHAAPAPATRPSLRPPPPRKPMAASPASDAAWRRADVGDVVEFKGQQHLRGRVASRALMGGTPMLSLDRLQRRDGGRWAVLPAGQVERVLSTKGTLTILQESPDRDAPATPSGTGRADDDAALMEQFERVRSQLEFYGAEGAAPSVERFAAMTRSNAAATLALLEQRVEAERAVTRAPVEAPDFGAFIKGNRGHGGALRGLR